MKCHGDDDINMDVWGEERCQMTWDAQTRDPWFGERGELDSPVSQTLLCTRQPVRYVLDGPCCTQMHEADERVIDATSRSKRDTEDGMESDKIEIVAGGSGRSTGWGSGAATAGPGDDAK
ncbi:hypothetical protein CORC01_13580 [Colletotrichum orchidophilum]|uniref:Uncharacterized protein n=1 Tax=Colletotrichum orchidophilum TaxID=1209926 RepID=A0A1G4APX5_9PEZI|nr:uncharacterized protein CORC01_13580 [Colletotrichum orchidophilum]OHE91133.1 hypothetical protein CORC01_13580 [Colletotrichum orchidophilum]